MLPRQRFSKAISFVFLVHATLVSAAASINCDKANSDQDRVICSNEKLHILDMELAMLLSAAGNGETESDAKEISRVTQTLLLRQRSHLWDELWLSTTSRGLSY